MTLNLSKQYNRFSDIFSMVHDDGNKYSNRVFFDVLREENIQGKKILDLGCGNGTDMQYYKYRFGDDIYGVDASEKFIKEASAKKLNVSIGLFDKIPHEEKSFDVVVSKYALQTVDDFKDTYKEVSRVLKPGGKFIFLTVHPMRQFFEKKTKHKNFFQKTIVKSVLFGGKIIAKEPTHTLEEYLSLEFFKLFNLEKFIEKDDFYSAEQLNGDKYPTYMIISATKK